MVARGDQRRNQDGFLRRQSDHHQHHRREQNADGEACEQVGDGPDGAHRPTARAHPRMRVLRPVVHLGLFRFGGHPDVRDRREHAAHAARRRRHADRPGFHQHLGQRQLADGESGAHEHRLRHASGGAPSLGQPVRRAEREADGARQRQGAAAVHGTAAAVGPGPGRGPHGLVRPSGVQSPGPPRRGDAGAGRGAAQGHPAERPGQPGAGGVPLALLHHGLDRLGQIQHLLSPAGVLRPAADSLSGRGAGQGRVQIRLRQSPGRQHLLDQSLAVQAAQAQSVQLPGRHPHPRAHGPAD